MKVSTLPRVASAFLLVALLLAGTPTSAAASVGSGYCAHGANATSSSCVNSRFGETYAGAYGAWNNNTMWLDSPGAQSGPHYDLGYHINWEMWFYTTSNEYQFIEMGLRDGKGSWIPCGCRDYAIFWAEWDTAGREHPHWLASTGPNGAHHTYQINRAATANVWSVLLDGNVQGTTSYQTSWNAYEIQTGLEVSRAAGETVGTWAHADTFDSQPMYSLSPSGVWSTWSYNTDWIDQPCGAHNGLPAYPSGSCFNGNAPATYYWQANKP